MAIVPARPGGRPVYLSEGLAARGIPHAFGTRLGGVSVGPRAGANASFFNGDDPAAVDRNWRELLGGIGLGGASLHVLRQVHGADLAAAGTGEAGPRFTHEGAADGLTTDRPGRALAVVTADCVPVLAYFEAPAMAAALHCGWRGTLAGLLPALLAAAGRPPAVLALGPHIRRDRFEVGPELRARFEAAFRAAGGDPAAGVRPGPGDRLLVDLEALLVAQARSAGVPAAALELGAPCTFSREDEFYSFRRDGPGRGLLGHVIGLPGPG